MSERPSKAAHLLVAGVLPGLTQLFAGRRALGGTVLAGWLFLWWVVLTRWNRIVASLDGQLDERIALASLILLLAGMAVWSLVRAQARPSTDEGAGVSQWVLAARAFRRNRLAVIGALVIAALYALALLTPFLAPSDPTVQGSLLTERLQAPTSANVLGTDRFARDVLSRLLYGARVSLSIGFIAVGIAVTIGTLLGATSGFLGGRIDQLVMRFVDVVISFPRLILLITIIAILREPSIFTIIAVLGLTQWPHTTRIVRGEVLSLREREFIQAARALGFSKARIILRHLVPNAMGPVIVAATLGIGNTIVLEAGLSFLGIGVQPPTPSWGAMVADGRDNLIDAWWISTFPGLAIVLTVLAFNLVGDGLRDGLDPRLRS